MSKLPTVGVHAAQLERWLGTEKVERLSRAMRDWYGPPIAVAGVPGRVKVYGGGDFRGRILSGRAASAFDAAEGVFRRLRRGLEVAAKNHGQLNAGFASLSDLIAASTTAGRKKVFQFQKVGVTGVANVTNSLWQSAGMPGVGAAGSAAPGGRAPTDATTGAFPYTNPSAGTLHFVVGNPIASVVNNSLLLYDRIFDVAKTMNSTANESVTGVPSRYQNTSSGTADSAEGNFLAIEVQTALAATAHNWDSCLYTDQAGNGSAALPTVTGNSSAIVQRLDQPAGTWFCPLADGDNGIKELDQMHCSAAVATGAINFVIGHPIAFMPCQIANQVCVADGVTTALNLERIFDDAALAFLELCKPATTATTYTGQFNAVSN